MRFDFLEVPGLQGPQVESREERDYNEYRDSEFELCQQSLPEYACVSQILEPHPVGDESDEHDKNCQHKSYKHDGY